MTTRPSMEFINNEMNYFRSQIRMELRELEKPNLDWRMRSLAENKQGAQ